MDDFIAPGDPERTARLFEVVGERATVDGLTMLDLACRTGTFSTAFANAGATVYGIEGRPENFDRIPQHPNATYELGDVRALSVDKHGTFDVTLCMGILYHLGPDDAVNLLRAMRAVTTKFAVVDTHVANSLDSVSIEGHWFDGAWYGEPPGLWSSIGNDRSWWFTPNALTDACRLAGWATVDVVDGPIWPQTPLGRLWLVLS